MKNNRKTDAMKTGQEKKFRPAHTFLQNKRPAAHGPRPADTHQYKEKP